MHGGQLLRWLCCEHMPTHETPADAVHQPAATGAMQVLSLMKYAAPEQLSSCDSGTIVALMWEWPGRQHHTGCRQVTN